MSHASKPQKNFVYSLFVNFGWPRYVTCFQNGKKISKTGKECFSFEIQNAVMLLVQSVSVICAYIWARCTWNADEPGGKLLDPELE